MSGPDADIDTPTLEAELMALNDEAELRKQRIDHLDRTIKDRKKAAKEEVLPVRRFTISTSPNRTITFGEHIIDPAVIVLDIRGLLLNGPDLVAAGHKMRDTKNEYGIAEMQVQSFMFNTATGVFICTVRGGYSIVSDGKTFSNAPPEVLSRIADRWLDNGDGADITDIITSIPERKPF